MAPSDPASRSPAKALLATPSFVTHLLKPRQHREPRAAKHWPLSHRTQVPKESHVWERGSSPTPTPECIHRKPRSLMGGGGWVGVHGKHGLGGKGRFLFHIAPSTAFHCPMFVLQIKGPQLSLAWEFMNFWDMDQSLGQARWGGGLLLLSCQTKCKCFQCCSPYWPTYLTKFPRGGETPFPGHFVLLTIFGWDVAWCEL